MARQPSTNVVSPEVLPVVERIAEWFFTTKNEIPGRFFYYYDGGSGVNIVLSMRMANYYPELFYTDTNVAPEDFEQLPVPASVVVYGWRGLWGQMVDNIYVPWEFETPSDALCQQAFSPNVMYDLMEVTAVKVNGQYALSHVQPSWLLNVGKCLHLL